MGKMLCERLTADGDRVAIVGEGITKVTSDK